MNNTKGKSDLSTSRRDCRSQDRESITNEDERCRQTGAPDAKSVSSHVAEILKQCDGMAKMHGGPMEHKMTGPKTAK